MERHPVILSIAGSDCSGGAGIQADIKTLTVHKVYAMTCITALTAQNTVGITEIMPVPAEFFKKQMESIFVRLEILRLLAWENCHSDRIRNIRQSKNICR